jgi:hypothetical protein
MQSSCSSQLKKNASLQKSSFSELLAGVLRQVHHFCLLLFSEVLSQTGNGTQETVILGGFSGFLVRISHGAQPQLLPGPFGTCFEPEASSAKSRHDVLSKIGHRISSHWRKEISAQTLLK